ncbi:hypothetical protein G6F57_002207 [Rhizopus arrhizus]|uniref:Protein PNS1 n=1 Tax=Rhizopus oryzae TaxID=64495 RepID=A0A9P7BY32_RHIOR|nr:hypothetical protein G6F23_006457 [Rhizopus arrhizus]KAG1428227.1 hypothetical protein G6F58_000663 [Rhizopus delemar]KAG0768463.1 hypothetical protein G6F24_001919 [Rhizopus arrhizus]KAG0793927.1 hypothetical protein G6F21_003252 [Rhizopus arrhizus]KAG0802662.1 hypothetical protein G6F22_000043 [Rhizopus arrhizus]
MDAESENEEDNPNSLFYSVHQSDHINEDSIPLTLSNAYSDRSQLLFEQSDSLSDNEDEEEHLKPSSIYLDQPEPSEAAVPFNPKSLSESLLPTASTIPPGITQMDRKYKDPIFAVFYALSFLAFVLSGFIVLFMTDSHSVEDYVKESTFKVIKDSAGMLVAIIGTSLIIATIWLLVLRHFTKALVWGTVICVPIILSASFIWSFVESLQYISVYKGNQELSLKDTALTWLSIIPLILNLIYVKAVYSSRHRINKTIVVIELACEMIRSNPAILFVPVLLLVIFIIFTSIWIAFFNRLWLIGHLVDPSTSSKAIWIVNNYVYFLAAFYIFFYMWTSMILIYLEKFVLSGMIAQWYFHRKDTINNSVNVLKSSMIRGTTTSFGTIALSGFLMAIVHFSQFVIKQLKKYSKKSRPFATFIEFILSYIEPFVSIVNHYTIGLAGITGESFFSAANSATKIFKRNLLSGIFGGFLAQIILHIGTAAIALTSGLSAYIYATHQLHSPHGFIVGLIGTLMPYYISQFYSYVMMSIIDATFLCYAIDLDAGTVNLQAAHSAFSGYD